MHIIIRFILIVQVAKIKKCWRRNTGGKIWKIICRIMMIYTYTYIYTHVLHLHFVKINLFRYL